MKESGNGKENSKTAMESFDRFLLTEYQNIAKAHFNTISAISAFFRYYLILMALPIALYSAIIGLLREGGKFIDVLGMLTSIISFVIALVGFSVLIYIINLRMDAILYARTVNGIRKYFYDNVGIEIETKLRIRVLPQTTSVPRYFETSFFLPVIFSFAVFNSIYLFLGLILFSTSLTSILGFAWDQILNWMLGIPMWKWILVLLFFFGHFISYWFATRHREHSYLKSFAMGVDIDGVLNKHRHHFCKLLNELVQKQLDPEQITSIPVHENQDLGVSRTDERKVFNDPRYWVEMPCINDAAYNIEKLRNLFKLKIYIFTHRPWPSKEIYGNKNIYKKWMGTASQLLVQFPCATSKLLRILRSSKNLSRTGISKLVDRFVDTRMETTIRHFALRPIDVITKHWLHSNSIQYDKLVIERGSEDISDPQGEFWNRFYVSRKRKIRFFVEDDHEKASKLAYICDIVFLMKQPYNQGKKLPSNVLLVSSWGEIYRWIRKLS